MWLSGEKSVKNGANKCLVCLRKTRDPGVAGTESGGECQEMRGKDGMGHLGSGDPL